MDRRKMTTTTTSKTWVLDPDTGDVWEDGVNDGQTADWTKLEQLGAVDVTCPDDGWQSAWDLVMDELDQRTTAGRPPRIMTVITDDEGFGASGVDLRPGETRTFIVWTA